MKFWGSAESETRAKCRYAPSVVLFRTRSHREAISNDSMEQKLFIYNHECINIPSQDVTSLSPPSKLVVFDWP